MSDDTLTLDALVEEVARALRRTRLLRADAGPVWRAFNDEALAEDADRAIARAALAAVAMAAGVNADNLKYVGSAFAVLANQNDMNWPTQAKRLRRVAALLRTLAEAAP